MIGQHKDLSNEEYHAHTESISRSAIMEFEKSPYHYWAKYRNDTMPKEEPTQAMIFGNAFHTLILEPEKFNDLYAPEPPKVLLKNVGQEKYDEYKKLCKEIETSNRIILTDVEYLTLKCMEKALKNDSKAMALIEGAAYENSFFWRDKESGLICKARPDIMHPNMFCDLKTCADASYRAFQRATVDGGYHIQAAMTRDGVREVTGKDITNFIFIAIEKKYPFAIAIYILDETVMDFASEKYKKILLEISHAIAHNSFSSYEPQTLILPTWAMNL